MASSTGTLGSSDILPVRLCIAPRGYEQCGCSVYIYRTSVVEVVETYQHDDTDDTFEREPFSVLFRTVAGSDGKQATMGSGDTNPLSWSTAAQEVH